LEGDHLYLKNKSLIRNNIYSQTCLMWPSNGTVKYGHIKQVVT
jgi:hypothetical protein